MRKSTTSNNVNLLHKHSVFSLAEVFLKRRHNLIYLIGALQNIDKFTVFEQNANKFICKQFQL
jgi:hypothetical protein